MTSEELELAKSVMREAKSLEVIDTPGPTDPTEIIRMAQDIVDMARHWGVVQTCTNGLSEG